MKQLSKQEYKYRCKLIAENHFNKKEQKMLDGMVSSYKEEYLKESSIIVCQIKFCRVCRAMALMGTTLGELANSLKNFYQAVEESHI